MKKLTEAGRRRAKEKTRKRFAKSRDMLPWAIIAIMTCGGIIGGQMAETAGVDVIAGMMGGAVMAGAFAAFYCVLAL
jgi:hypothetical protein